MVCATHLCCGLLSQLLEIFFVNKGNFPSHISMLPVQMHCWAVLVSTLVALYCQAGERAEVCKH